MTLSDLAKYSMTRSVARSRGLSAIAELLVIFDVLNNLINNLLNVKCSDCIDLLSKLHTSRAKYANILLHWRLFATTFIARQYTDARYWYSKYVYPSVRHSFCTIR